MLIFEAQSLAPPSKSTNILNIRPIRLQHFQEAKIKVVFQLINRFEKSSSAIHFRNSAQRNSVVEKREEKKEK